MEEKIREFSDGLEKTIKVIKEAESYAEYDLSDAYSELSETSVAILNSIANKENVDIKAELSSPAYVAWSATLNDKIELVDAFADSLEKFGIDTTKLREAIEESKFNLKKSEELFYGEKYEESINLLKKSTEDLYKIDKKWNANKSNLIKNLIFKLLGITAIIWTGTISQYSRIGSILSLLVVLAIEFGIIFYINSILHKLLYPEKMAVNKRGRN